MKMFIRTLSLILMAATTAACSNPVCDPPVLERLLQDCSLQVSSANFSACAGLPDSPMDNIPSLVEACEIVDPNLDAECLRTATCEQITMGQCSDSNGSDVAPIDQMCFSECFSAGQTCSESCGMEAAYAGCSDCLLECEREIERCEANC